MDIRYLVWLAVLGFLLLVSIWASYLSLSRTKIVIVSSSPQLYRKWAITDAFMKASKLKGVKSVKKIKTYKSKFGWYCVLWVVADENNQKNVGDFIPADSVVAEGA